MMATEVPAEATPKPILTRRIALIGGNWFVWISVALLALAGIGDGDGNGDEARDTPPEEPTPFAITELDESIVVQIAKPTLGEATTLSLSGVRPAPDGALTRISTLHTVGLVEYRAEQWAPVIDGTAELTVPTAAMREAGQHRFTVFTDAQFGELAISIDPGPPTPGMVPIVGPSRVEADGVSPVLVTVTATDEFGNPVADGTDVTLVVRRPNGSEERFVGTTDQLISGIRVPSTTDVGVASVVAIVDGVPSEPVEFSQVAGPPARATLAVSTDEVPADGRSVFEVTAADVVDANGNPVTDGTALRARLDGPSGSSTLDTQVINGRAVFVARAPSAPGTLTFRLAPAKFASVATSDADAAETLSIDTGNTLTLQATIAVASLEATLDETDTVVVGPVLGPSGGLIADGTPVRLLLNGQPVARAQLVDGRATLPIPNGASIGASDRLAVETLGLVQEVQR